MFYSSQYLRLYLSSVTTDAYNSPTLTQDLLSKLTSLIDHYLEAWKADNVRRAEKEQEMTSLYSFKQHGEEIETDEQLIDKMTQQNFPSYHQVSVYSKLICIPILICISIPIYIYVCILTQIHIHMCVSMIMYTYSYVYIIMDTHI